MNREKLYDVGELMDERRPMWLYDTMDDIDTSMNTISWNRVVVSFADGNPRYTLSHSESMDYNYGVYAEICIPRYCGKAELCHQILHVYEDTAEDMYDFGHNYGSAQKMLEHSEHYLRMCLKAYLTDETIDGKLEELVSDSHSRWFVTASMVVDIMLHKKLGWTASQDRIKCVE